MLTLPPPGRSAGDPQTGQPLDPEPNVSTRGPNLDALDQEPNDPGLFGGKRLVPERVELGERVTDLALGKGKATRPSGPATCQQ